MTRPHEERLLAYTAQRARARPEYLAWVLARYAELEHIAEGELAQHLGIAAHDLPRLALCLRPRAEHFAADVMQISTKFSINPAALATVVHLVDSVEVLAARDAGEVSTDAGLLMAARARKHPPSHDDLERRDHDHPES
jgi:hypothetical protein